MTVEEAVDAGLLGGFSAYDVRALSEGHAAEAARLRNARAQQQRAAVAAASAQHATLLRQAQVPPP